MKNVLIVGGAAVGIYLVWRYCTKPVAAEDATAAAPSAAASSMTYSGAANTLVGGTTRNKGLLALPAPLLSVARGVGSLAGIVRRDANTIASQTARADARMQVAPAAPASTGLPILGMWPVLGTLPANDYGGGYVPGFPGTRPGSNLK
jgi:hypothetical protein